MLTMDQWLDIASKFGIPVTMLGLLTLFIVRHVWPFVIGQIEDAKAQRKIEVDKFMDALRTRDTMMSEAQRGHLKAIEAMTVEIRGLRSEVRKSNSK
jgi:hypothetical protein